MAAESKTQPFRFCLTSWFLLSRWRCSASCSSLFCSWEISRSCFSSWLFRRWRVSVSERSSEAWKNIKLEFWALPFLCLGEKKKKSGINSVYLNCLEVCQKQILSPLLAQDSLLLLVESALIQLQHISLLAQILHLTLMHKRVSVVRYKVCLTLKTKNWKKTRQKKKRPQPF